MKYNSNFSHDLELGQLGERALGAILSNKKIEVKTDLQAQITGNVFVEYESRGKPSGIATSKADYWCFIISNTTLILIESEKLKQIARANFHRTIAGGDSNTSKGILIAVKALTD